MNKNYKRRNKSMRNIKNFIGLFLASIILTSCGLKTYEEMHSPYPRLIVREGPKAEQAIEDLKAKGYIIKKIRPSATIEGAIVVFYEIPETKVNLRSP